MDPFGKEVEMYIKVDELKEALKKNSLLWHVAGQNLTDLISKLPKYELKQPKEKKVKK